MRSFLPPLDPTPLKPIASKVLGSLLPTAVKTQLRSMIGKRWALRAVDEAYAKAQRTGQPLRVVLGGHWTTMPDWLIFAEPHQDITERLLFRDDSVDVIFTEHVIEHLPFAHAIHFFKEAHRSLKPGGYMRVVAPGVDQLIRTDQDPEKVRRYVQDFVRLACKEEDDALKELSLAGVHEEPHTFWINATFRNYGHHFMWSVALLKKVLEKVGFSEVLERSVGEGYVPQNCIERRNRHEYWGHDAEEDRKYPICDMESIVVEARK